MTQNENNSQKCASLDRPESVLAKGAGAPRKQRKNSSIKYALRVSERQARISSFETCIIDRSTQHEQNLRVELMPAMS